MSFNNGDIVKLSQEEPCIIYRVVDKTEQMIENKLLMKVCPHIRIEVMGMVPVECLTSAYGHPKSIFAIDKKLGAQQN